MSKKLILASVSVLVMAITTQTATAVFNTSAISSSSAEETLVSENDLLSELGVSEPKLLPDSPFYFLKNIKRKVKEFFTFDPIKKNELRLKFAAEKLLEAKKVAEKKQDTKALVKALKNYEKEVEKIKKAFKSKNKQQIKRNDPKVNLFVNKLIKHEILHEKILKSLQERVPRDVSEKIKTARERHIAAFSEVMTGLQDKESLKKNFRETISALGKGELKELQNLEALKEIQKYAPSTTSKEVANEAIEATLFHLKEKLAKLPEKEQKRLEKYFETRVSRDPTAFEVIQDIKSGFSGVPQANTRFQEIEDKAMEKIKEQQKRMGCKEITWPERDFCKKGRIVPELNKEGCIIGFKCIIPAETKNQGIGGAQTFRSSILPSVKNKQIVNKKEIPDEYKKCLEDLSEIDIKSEIQRKIRICLGNPTTEEDFWNEAMACLRNLCPKVLEEEVPESCKKLIDSQKICEKIDKIHQHWTQKPEEPLIFCPQVWDPVCGKDNQTYSNACWAKAAGVEISHEGICEEVKSPTIQKPENKLHKIEYKNKENKKEIEYKDKKKDYEKKIKIKDIEHKPVNPPVKPANPAGSVNYLP